MRNEFSDSALKVESGLLPIRLPSQYPHLSSKDPAVHGMTDFTRKLPFSVGPERSTDEALADMVRFGVRALLVVCGDSVIGLITSYGIENAGKPAGSVRVGDVMTPWNDLPTVDWSTIQSSRIADLLEIFHGIGVMHLLVVEGRDGIGPTMVRGLVARARCEDRLTKADALPYEYQKAG